ncbi:MAG: tRNA-modifying protein YgfZ [Gammaproteobacteria bacterium]|jgi:folate-binding protein YgfZ|nr:tRNA-modifying protein YgfZ [Gammaproteobacteria bacterium]
MNDSNGATSPLDTATPTFGSLPQFGLLRFAGPDNMSFLQGQLSNDTDRLTAGAPLLAAYSTPQGRVVAVLHLLPHSSGVMAILPREIVLPTVERLRKYVLRAKVRIEDVSDQFAVFGRNGVDASTADGLPAPDAAHAYVERDGIGVARLGSDRQPPPSNRYWVIGTPQDLKAYGTVGQPKEEPRLEHAWRLADIRAGLPQIYAATREMFVAQMLNLDLIDGISFTKGCFTGQEIIARTQHLGRIKRRLHRLRLPAGSWAVGQAVHLTDGRSGRLTELAAAGRELEALAVLTLETGSAAGATGAQEMADAGAATSTLVDATELPLPYALGSA